jgi:hypothetical protein
VPITSLNKKIIRNQIAGKVAPVPPLVKIDIKSAKRKIIIKGPYKNTNRLRTNKLAAHKNQHNNALKILAFVNQLSSLDYHQLFEFKYQVSIKK